MDALPGARGTFRYRARLRPAEMPREALHASLGAARRLAVRRQRLSGPLPRRVTGRQIEALVADLGFVQWDPVGIVAPSHLLSFWARLGPGFRPAQLERLLWTEKRLFEHWTPMASIVRTEDYPIFGSLMERYPGSLSTSWGRQRAEARRFLTAHARLRGKVLEALRSGPRRMGDFEDHARTRRPGSDWAPSSDLSEMLYHLTMNGEVMVVGHEGSQNLWGLPDRFLPPGVTGTRLSPEEYERTASQRALRALGTATPREITLYFVRGRYDHLAATLAALEAEGHVRRVNVDGLPDREARYVHALDVDRLHSLEGGDFEPRLSLLPPFDNLVGSSVRLHRLFGFDYVREQFLPKEKRRYGTYVLPILRGDRFIGRIDPRLDRANRTLEILAVHAEPDAPTDRTVADEVARAIDGLATFVGAERVRYRARVPPSWKASLR